MDYELIGIPCCRTQYHASKAGLSTQPFATKQELGLDRAPAARGNSRFIAGISPRGLIPRSAAVIESERIVTRLTAEGYEITGSYEGADMVIVNSDKDFILFLES